MIYSIDKSFERDAKKVPVQILRALTDVIRSINTANNLREISNIKKLQGYKNCYRIRIDDYCPEKIYTRDSPKFSNNRKQVKPWFSFRPYTQKGAIGRCSSGEVTAPKASPGATTLCA